MSAGTPSVQEKSSKFMYNALIEGTRLGKEDHGIMTFSINLKYDSSHQSFGNYVLDNWESELKERVGTAWGMDAVIQILNTVGVSCWEDLPGKYVRIRKSDPFGSVDAIGHIIEDKWLKLSRKGEDRNKRLDYLFERDGMGKGD